MAFAVADIHHYDCSERAISVKVAMSSTFGGNRCNDAAKRIGHTWKEVYSPARGLLRIYTESSTSPVSCFVLSKSATQTPKPRIVCPQRPRRAERSGRLRCIGSSFSRHGAERHCEIINIPEDHGPPTATAVNRRPNFDPPHCLERNRSNRSACTVLQRPRQRHKFMQRGA
jgi:hypothetical protein